jgi:anti-anti-sigma regulatory factor
MITRSPDGKIVMLSVTGCFDLSLGFALWQYCKPEEYHYQKYVFNLSEVSDVRDSGLTWLRMFVKWAQQGEATVRLITRPEIKEDFIAAGLDVDDGAALAKRPTRD